MQKGSRRTSDDPQRQAAREAHFVLIALTLTAIVGVFILLRPYLHSIILALLLASLFGPAHRRIKGKVGDLKIRGFKVLGRDTASALLSVLLVSMLVVIPVALFSAALVKQGVNSFQAVQEWVKSGDMREALNSQRVQEFLAHPRVQSLRDFAETRLEGVDLEKLDLPKMLMGFSQNALEFTGKRVLPAIQATGSLLFGFAIMLFVMFYAFRDGHRATQHMLHLSPLTTTQENALIDKVKDVTRAAVLGTVVTAVAQGIAAMIGFKIVGIPALFWGTMLGASSIIPAIGTALVWVPAVGYLLVIGHVGSAIFLFAWCAVVVGSIDNFLRPMLMGGNVGMSTVVIFFAILGGIQCFGLIGIIYGPLIFGLCAVCLYIYELENAQFLARQDER